MSIRFVRDSVPYELWVRAVHHWHRLEREATEEDLAVAGYVRRGGNEADRYQRLQREVLSAAADLVRLVCEADSEIGGYAESIRRIGLRLAAAVSRGGDNPRRDSLESEAALSEHVRREGDEMEQQIIPKAASPDYPADLRPCCRQTAQRLKDDFYQNQKELEANGRREMREVAPGRLVPVVVQPNGDVHAILPAGSFQRIGSTCTCGSFVDTTVRVHIAEEPLEVAREA